MKKCLTVVLFLAAVLPVPARQVVNLNRGWEFVPGYEASKSYSEPVNLPHTWNTDALGGAKDYYRGLCSYIRNIDVPASWSGKRVFVRFHGVNTVANVLVNGKHVGEHRGGYTAFAFDITPQLRFGERNSLWVRVNNSPQLDVMPLVGDFNIYGGIYRDVELIVTEPNHVSLADYGSDGVYITPQKVSPEKASLDVLVKLTGMQGVTSNVNVSLVNGDRDTVARDSKKVKFDNDGAAAATLSLNVDKPRLWQGRNDPYLYETVVEVATGGAKDMVTVPTGIRTVKISHNQLLINDKPYPVRGVCYSSDRAVYGEAVYKEHLDADMAAMGEMGANSIRTVNHPQGRHFYSLCDRAGMVAWCDLPFTGPGDYRDKGYIDMESFKANGKRQLAEMIMQQYNNPSVCLWGIFNSLIVTGDDPVPYIKELNSLAHALDPTRPTVAASTQDGQINFVTDAIGWNQYFGWAQGRASDIGIWIDNIKGNPAWSNLNAAISEYGAGGSPFCQQAASSRPAPSGRTHPEGWQTAVHEEYYHSLTTKPKLWGAYVKSMFDYADANRNDGDLRGVCDLGLVTFDRAIRKDAFYFYKANWNNADPFVYIADRRWCVRKEGAYHIKIFSNLPEAELVVNGESKGSLPTTGGKAVWNDILLTAGNNEIVAVSGEFRDTITITCDVELTGDL